jgi:integrase/recombinase XerD
MTRRFDNKNKAKMLSRTDVNHVFEYARANCCLSDYLLVRLFMQTGIRTGEICTLRIENIDFEKCHFHVLDSKKKELFELPVDVETVELLKLFLGERREGYVFQQVKTWRNVRHDKPLTRAHIWQKIKKIGQNAGVQGLKPRTFRQYFSAYWHYKKHGSTKGLQHYLRHDNLASTDAYLESLFFTEDLEVEYRVCMDHVARALDPEQLPPVCRNCGNVSVCKLIEEIKEEIWDCMTDCKFKQVTLDACSNSLQIQSASKQLGQ